ncbi:MAG: 1-acyl-sn-glycerol-3-phosphate acyltransferase [Alphaproteobacteria bacterium]|nr:1-acyl-sn-glycerol-3-phosphate acyltransferase [Alphaproteobacteria bacterium]
MTFIRSLIYAGWFYVSMALVGLPWLPVAFLSRGAAVGAIRFWAATQRFALHWICGIRTEFRGLENIPEGPCVIAMKHQSTYDTIAPFLFLRDPAFVLKRELLRMPVFGLYAARARMIAIDRSGGLKTMKLMLAAAKVQNQLGRPVVIFPEGTRQLVDAPTDLKPGAFAMYRELEAPCVPVALNTGLCWRGSGFIRRPGVAVFECLPVIEPGLDRAEFTRRLKSALDPATARLVSEGRSHQSRRDVAANAAERTEGAG